MTLSPGRLGPHTVNRLGFGAMPLPGKGVLGPPKDRAAAVAVVRRAVELGVDHLDTASFYGPDVANEILSESLAPWPGNVRVVSKVGASRSAEGAWTPALSPDEIRQQVERDLRVLGIDRLTAVNLRMHENTDDATLTGHTLLIPGTSSVGHLEENLRTADVELPEAAVTELDALAAPG